MQYTYERTFPYCSFLIAVPRSLSHLLSVEVVEAVREDLVDAVRVGEGDEAEAPRPLRRRVLHHHHLGDVAEFAKVLLEAL